MLPRKRSCANPSMWMHHDLRIYRNRPGYCLERAIADMTNGGALSLSALWFRCSNIFPIKRPDIEPLHLLTLCLAERKRPCFLIILSLSNRWGFPFCTRAQCHELDRARHQGQRRLFKFGIWGAGKSRVPHRLNHAQFLSSFCLCHGHSSHSRPRPAGFLAHGAFVFGRMYRRRYVPFCISSGNRGLTFRISVRGFYWPSVAVPSIRYIYPWKTILCSAVPVTRNRRPAVLVPVHATSCVSKTIWRRKGILGLSLLLCRGWCNSSTDTHHPLVRSGCYTCMRWWWLEEKPRWNWDTDDCSSRKSKHHRL